MRFFSDISWTQWKLWTLGSGLLMAGLLVAPPPSTGQGASVEGTDDGTAGVEAAIAEAATTLLTDRFSVTPRQVKVEVTRLAGEAASIDREVQVDTSSPLRNRPRGRMQVNVQERTGTSWADRGWALLDVAYYDSVAVIETTVGSDDAVDTDDLALTWMETTRFHGTPLRADDLRELKEQDSLYATRRLTEGSTLRSGDLRSSYAAETGSTVVMHYERGAVNLELRCTARQSGFVGDTVRLYSPDTQTTYRARLTGPRTAEWIETL